MGKTVELLACVLHNRFKGPRLPESLVSDSISLPACMCKLHHWAAASFHTVLLCPLPWRAMLRPATKSLAEPAMSGKRRDWFTRGFSLCEFELQVRSSLCVHAEAAEAPCSR